MKTKLLPLLFFACAACAGPRHDQPASRDFTARIDQLCASTGMRRVGPIESVERQGGADSGYNIRVKLATDQHTHRYIVRFNSKRQFYLFNPQYPFWWDPTSDSPEFKDPQQRAACTAAIRRFNQYLHWHMYGRGWFYQRGNRFLVMYPTAPEGDYMAIDPFGWYYLTRNGIIYGNRFGM